MLAKPITLAATVLAASATHAFLLPPDVSESDVRIASTAAAITPSSAESQLVKLDCPGCPVVIHGPRGTRVIPDKPNHLELTFSVDHQPEGDRLLVNGFELHPNPVPGILTAPQALDWKPWHHGPGRGRGPFGWHHGKKDHDGEHKHHSGLPPFLRIDPQPLGFAMSTNPSSARDADSQLELVTIDFQVVEVANAFFDTIPQLHVKLIKDASGRLMIGNIEQSAPAPKTGAAEPEKCTTLLCKWLQAIFPKGPARPCHGQRPGARPVAAGQTTPSPDDDIRERWGSGVRHHHSWGQLLKNIASHILLPVLIGIVAGVSVSIIGMVVGTIAVSLWRTFVRRSGNSHRHHRRRSSHHKIPPKEAIVDDEKTGLMEQAGSYDADIETETDVEVEVDEAKKADQQV